MSNKYTIEMTYEQLLEFQSYLMWSTTSYKDKTMLELVMKMVREIQAEKDNERQQELEKGW
jgi:hypothetical protein